MRLLTLLATTVLLAGCVHDTDDYTLFLTESGASLTYYIGGEKSGGEEDPWSKILNLFAKSDGKHDDLWTTITDKFGLETVHTGSGKLYDDPWDTISESFPLETVYVGKAKVSSFEGGTIVKMLFVSIGGEKSEGDEPWNRISEYFPTKGSGEMTLTLVEVRNEIGEFMTTDGRSIFGVQIPAEWKPGLVLKGEAYLLESKKMLPLMGAIVWEVDRALSSDLSPRERGDMIHAISGPTNAVDHD